MSDTPQRKQVKKDEEYTRVVGVPISAHGDLPRRAER